MEPFFGLFKLKSVQFVNYIWSYIFLSVISDSNFLKIRLWLIGRFFLEIHRKAIFSAPSSKPGNGLCDNPCPTSCLPNNMQCFQGEDSMGCKIPDLCFPPPSKKLDLLLWLAMFSLNCIDNSTSCKKSIQNFPIGFLQFFH